MPAWGQFFSSLKRGELKDAGNYLFLDGDDVERGANAEAAITELNRKKVEDGTMSREAYANYMNRMNANAFPTAELPGGGIFDHGESPIDGFQEGAQEGLDNMAAGVNKVLDTTLSKTSGFIWKAVPWYVWVILFLVVVYILVDKLNLWPRKA